MIIVLNLYLSQVNTVPTGVCDYLYGRDVDRTGKFCAGGSVDACQVIIIIVVNTLIISQSVMLIDFKSAETKLLSSTQIDHFQSTEMFLVIGRSLLLISSSPS